MLPKLRSVGLVCAMVAICFGLAAFAVASPLRGDAALDAGRMSVILHDWRERLRDRLRHPLPALRGVRSRCKTCDARHGAAWSAPVPA